MLVWKPRATTPEQEVRELVSAVMYLHTTFKNEVWLWRGQADEAFLLEPGMHTRVREEKRDHAAESDVVHATAGLVTRARELGIDRVRDTVLPDLALLALLQHYGAATPLLDVTVDPLVALWMVAFASAERPEGMDEKDGEIFAIRRPARRVAPLDARRYSAEALHDPSIAGQISSGLHWYQAPDISERLRIQRGSFVIGQFQAVEQTGSTLPLRSSPTGTTNWLQDRWDRRGKPGQPARATTDVVVFRVRHALKRPLRVLLEERSGLTAAAVFPTPWEKPFLEEFARGYGRGRPLAADLATKPKKA